MPNNKYSMTVQDNIFYAKRMLIDVIWKEAQLEGIDITFPETQMVFENMKIDGRTLDEILFINNLKKSWEKIIENVENKKDITLKSLNELNSIVGYGLSDFGGREGSLRKVGVGISGTVWRPDVPNMENVLLKLEHLNAIENPTERALNYYLELSRGQFFINGNKRMSALVCNQVLISNGAGILNIPITNRTERNKFGLMLVKYYETNDSTELKKYLFDCIDGMES